MSTLTNKVNPLAWNVPIVDTKTGFPSPEFQRKWAQQAAANGSVPDLTDAAGVSAVLDKIGAMQGDVLYRNATEWVVLAPGTAGQLLQTSGADANPTWVDPPVVPPALGLYSCFFSDGVSNYAALVNSAGDPEVILDGSGVPVYVPL